MKVFGWILSIASGGGIVGALIAKDSSDYKIDNFANLFGLGSGYKSTVDTILYLSVALLAVGLIMLAVAYTRKPQLANSIDNVIVPDPASYTGRYCLNCKMAVPNQSAFCPGCGSSLAQSVFSTKFCGQCGTALSAENRFCPICGEKT